MIPDVQDLCIGKCSNCGCIFHPDKFNRGYCPMCRGQSVEFGNFVQYDPKDGNPPNDSPERRHTVPAEEVQAIISENDKQLGGREYGSKTETEREKKEWVNHPDHYGGADNPYEAKKVIRAWKVNFSVGIALKHIARAGKKVLPGENKDEITIQDLEKAVWYLQDEIRFLKTGEV